jgi:hypothetical protein
MTATTTKRARNEALGLARRNDSRDAKKVAHDAMTARHAARKTAIVRYERALSDWHNADCTGPAPLDPRYYDMSLFPENRQVIAN